MVVVLFLFIMKCKDILTRSEVACIFVKIGS